tara:strand:- start:1749 stop:2207 length:459 start_codon:yes stop_codon:yes gene_type:complete
MKNTSKKLMLLLALVATSVTFAQMKPMDGSKMAMSTYSFNDTVEMLKGAIEQQNLMVLHEIDGQRMLKMAGKEVGGMKQLFFFHPSYMKKVVEANEMAGIVVPFKMIVMEKGGKVMVRYFMPSTILAPYKGTEAIAKDLDAKVTKIIAEATK